MSWKQEFSSTLKKYIKLQYLRILLYQLLVVKVMQVLFSL